MRRRLFAAVGVAALHVLLYLLLRGSGIAPTRTASRPTQPATTLRLLPWRSAPPRAVVAESPTRPAATPRPQGLRSQVPAAITPSAALSPSSATANNHAADDAPPPPEPAASQPPRPLDLNLPRGLATRPDARSPALDDARANSARRTPAQRMARSLDTTVIEDEMDNGRRRYRQGDTCVIVKPSRIGQLMPFNEAATRTPSLVSACP